MMNKINATLLGSVLALSAAHAQSTDLFNSLAGRSAGSDGVFSTGPLGESFSTSDSPVNLLNVELGLTDAGNTGTGSTTVTLYSSNLSSPAPQTLLATLGTVADSQLSSGIADYNIPLGTPYALAPDTQYWIVLTGTSDSADQWSHTSDASGPGVADEFIDNSSGISSTSDGPYNMDVSGVVATPEPSSLALIGAGCVAMFRIVRRRSSV